MVPSTNIAAACVLLSIPVSWLLPAVQTPAAGQPARRTEIVVIGTVHRATPNFGVSDLLRILHTVTPDIVLFEVDSSFVDRTRNRLLPRAQTMSLEAEAVTRYQSETSVPLYPYDIEGRNEIYQRENYFELNARFSGRIEALYREKALGPEANALYEALASVARIRDALGQDRPEVINSSGADAAIAAKQRYANEGLLKIVQLTPALAEFGGVRKFAAEFWERRNRAMVANILNHAKAFAGKRIVVLCGFEHRYYLVRELQVEQAKHAFSLREFRHYGR